MWITLLTVCVGLLSLSYQSIRVIAQKPRNQMFKVGDSVRIISTSSDPSCTHRVDSVGKIVEDDKSYRPFKIIVDGSTNEHCAGSKDIGLANPIKGDRGRPRVKPPLKARPRCRPHRRIRNYGIGQRRRFPIALPLFLVNE
jgi:hypothetical protein